MWQVVKRDVRFWIGVTFLSVLMIISIGYTLFFDGNIRELTMMYNEKRRTRGCSIFAIK